VDGVWEDMRREGGKRLPPRRGAGLAAGHVVVGVHHGLAPRLISAVAQGEAGAVREGCAMTDGEKSRGRLTGQC
jgi:hypothetical protein